VARTPEQIHDECLVLAAQGGDEEAFEALLRRWLPAMARQARRFVGDSDAAAEITQDAGLAIVRGLGGLKDPATFEAWVRRIVANKAADWIRRRCRQRRFERLVAPEFFRERRVRLSAEPAETVRLVRQALQALPVGLQVVVGLHYGEGRSVAETAGIIAVPLGTVKSRLYSARQRIMAIINGTNDDHCRRRP
jgi:RNA polymerase sigma-70 factor (ECF subfamily)